MDNDRINALTEEELQQVDGGSIGDQFSALPLDLLIGGPLQAAVDAQRQLAKSTADFIQTVGINSEEKK